MHESTSLRAALEAAGVVPVAGASTSAADVAAAWARIVESAAAEVGAAISSPEEWSEAQRAVVVDAVDRTARVLEAAKAPILVAQEQAGMWRRPGIRSFEAFRAAKNREDTGSARRETEAARTLTELEGGLDALARGEITPSHARQLRPVTDKMDPAARAELLSGEGASMVRELAKEHDPRVFGRKVEELAARRHPAEVQDAHEAIRARRFLRLRPGPEGTRIEGLLDPVAGHRFQLAIEAASPRPAGDDTRTLGQRNADALDAISGSVLAEGALAPPARAHAGHDHHDRADLPRRTDPPRGRHPRSAPPHLRRGLVTGSTAFPRDPHAGWPAAAAGRPGPVAVWVGRGSHGRGRRVGAVERGSLPAHLQEPPAPRG